MTEVQFAKQFLTTLDSKPTQYQTNHVFDSKSLQTRVPYTLPKLSHPPHPLPPKEQQPTAPIPGSEPAATTIDITLKSTRNPTFTLYLPSLPSKTPISTLKAQIQALLSQSPAQSPTQIASEKIKILYNKKPIPATKSTIEDVISSGSTSTGVPSSSPPQTEIEFGVMVMGGAPDPNPKTQTLNLNNELEPSSKDVGPESEKAAAEASEPQSHHSDPMSGVVHDTTSTTSKAETPEAVQPGHMTGRETLKTKEFWDDLQGFLEQRLRSSEVAVEVRGLFEKALQ